MCWFSAPASISGKPSFGSSIPDVPLIQVDASRTHIGKFYDADVALVGDARLVAEQLSAALPGRTGDDNLFIRCRLVKVLPATTWGVTSPPHTRPYCRSALTGNRP
ncbi:MAG: hypothetical protein Ct9H300mP16_13000 [Pseudomonadota bacterium]|nr:MAG: hypothetical protein Ct9H300mP16_13000 [Pseudomonadota bacterium]